MNFEDRIRIPKPEKGKSRGVINAKQTQASLDRGLAEVGKVYGFALEPGDVRCGIVSSRREGGFAYISYGARGRILDASQLAYELNN